MRLLVKGDGTTGAAVHLANAMSTPLCGTDLKRDAWHIEAQPTAQGSICEHCRRIHTAAFGTIEGSAQESEQEETPWASFVEPAKNAWQSDVALTPVLQVPALLIIDDDPHVLALLQLIIQNLVPAYEIIPLHDAHSALRHLAHRTVPLLITDYLMPGLNGLQLATAVKAISPMTHVILATTYGSAALEQRARAQDVDTFLPKADLFDRLADVVRSVLQLASARE